MVERMIRRTAINAILVILVAVLLGLLIIQPQIGCQNSAPRFNPGLRTVKVPVGNRTFRLEVANTNASRQTGLMHRDSMGADQGMIFVFPYEDDLAFYMRNTKIPLDILYLDAGGKVVSIHAMKPFDETSIWSAKPAKYAIELNQGMAGKTGVKVGDVVAIPKDVEALDR